MPVESVGTSQRIKKTQFYMDLCKKVMKNPTGAWNPDPWLVNNPAPHLFKTTWADPKKVEKKKRRYHARVVSAERGLKFYQLPEDECNKSQNQCMRLGCVLMEYDIEVYEAKEASMTVLSIAGVDKDIHYFLDNEETAIDMDAIEKMKEDPRYTSHRSTEVRRNNRNSRNSNQINQERRDTDMREHSQAVLRAQMREVLAGRNVRQTEDVSPEQAQEVLDAMEGIGRDANIRTVDIPDVPMDAPTKADSPGSQEEK